MIKRIAIIFGILLLGFSASAQNDELNRLTDLVVAMRKGGEKAYNKTVSTLANDKSWTPMDELGRDNSAECRVADKVPGFRLNSALTNAENATRYETSTGNHLNGADSRYNYSLYEKTLKAGKSATYTLNQRWGEQEFVFIPFDASCSDLKASITSGNSTFRASSLGNGMIKLTGRAVKGQPLKLKVSNIGPNNISYVIINYNSRK